MALAFIDTNSGRSIPVERKRRVLSAREAAERLFKKRCAEAANVNRPRILEAAPSAMPTPPAPPAAREETEHEKVFRLVGERKFEEAARLAKRLIDSGDVDGFFIYGSTPAYRKAFDGLTANIALSRKGAFSSIQSVTPELAQAILIRNDDNRLINARELSHRLRDIADDRWKMNGQGIILAKTGELNDGQHRLWAVIILGATVRIPIFYGALRETRDTLDTGQIRLSKDRFKFSGIPNDVQVSSVVGLAHRIIVGRDATEAEKVEYYYTDPDNFQAAVRVTGNLPKGSPSTSFAAAAYLALRAGHSAESVADFLREVRGVDTPRKGYPAFALMKLLLARQAKTLGKTPVEQAYTVASLYLRHASGKRQVGAITAATSMPEGL